VVAGQEAPMFSDDSLLHDDGWVTTADGQLLSWVPLEYHSNHPGLFWPRTIIIMGAQPTRLNMQRFVHGLQWMQCRTGAC